MLLRIFTEFAQSGRYILDIRITGDDENPFLFEMLFGIQMAYSGQACHIKVDQLIIGNLVAGKILINPVAQFSG